MTRSQFQRGPEKGHYHDTLGVDESAPAGAGVQVDNGTDPPAAVTTLVAPGAVIAGDSATLVTFRLARAEIDYQTPGVTDYPGVAVFAVLAGEWIVDEWIQLRSQFHVADANASYIQASLSTDGPVATDGPSWNVDGANALETTTPTGDLELNGHGGITDPLDHGAASIGNQSIARIVPARARIDCNVTAGVFTDGTGGLSAGTLTLFAIIATPAS